MTKPLNEISGNVQVKREASEIKFTQAQMVNTSSSAANQSVISYNLSNKDDIDDIVSLMNKN